MQSPPRIYLDNAATSWPKSEAVVEAVTNYLRNNGAPAGRSGYREAIAVDRQLQSLRISLARLVGAAGPDRIVFTSNGTDSLNLALHGLLRSGDHVVATDAEHNSVVRPLRWLSEQRGVEVEWAACDRTGCVDVDSIRRLLRPGKTRLVAVVHASNVTGTVQPIGAIAEAAKAAGALVLVDAAQSLGQWPVDVGRMAIDLLAAPGHKSLGGPLGTGVLVLAPGVEHQLQPLKQGGTGTHSQDDHQPDSLPDRFESGNLNVPGLVGLAAATAELEALTVENVQSHHRELTVRAVERLSRVSGVTLFGPVDSAEQVGVVSFALESLDPQETAGLLDGTFGVQTRAGLHCAPRMHRSIGSIDRGGTVRLSWGRATTVEMVDVAVDAIAELAGSV